MLELAILGLLKQRPMHGYDLRKRLRDDFGPMANLSFGSLYPALARLEAGRAVRAIGPVTPRARPDAAAELPVLAMTGSLTGERAALMARRATAKAAAALGGRGTRSRKVYEITSEGELLFEQLLEAPGARGEEARSFTLRLAFAQHLTPQARIRLLERRRMQLSDRLQGAKRALEAPARALDRYEHAIAEHAQETAESDLLWIERLLATERLAVGESHHDDGHDAPRGQGPARAGARAAATGTAGAISAADTDGRIDS